MDNLFKLVNVFQFFFKNSPSFLDHLPYLSIRHLKTTWCPLVRFREEEYDNISERPYFALTINKPNGENTIEFRYNDFPKSLNQLALYYYLNEITDVIIKNKDIHFEFKLLQINTLNELKKSLNWGYFTYKNPDSVLMFDSDYEDIILYFAKDIDLLFSKWTFYDFYDSMYKPFSRWIRASFKKESRMYEKYFNESITDDQWSDHWEKDFFKDIPRTLIRSTDSSDILS